MENVSCATYAAPPLLCSVVVSVIPEWRFPSTDVFVRLIHNNSDIVRVRARSAALDPSFSIQFMPIAMAIIPSVVQLRDVTSEIRVDGFGFTDCAPDTYGWTLWLQALSQDMPPNMMESRCSVMHAQALICSMPDWGALHPAGMIRVNVMDCLRQDVQQILPQVFTMSLLPSVLYMFPSSSSFKDATPVTIVGKGFSADLGLKVMFDGQFHMRAVLVSVINHTIMVASAPNWGSLIPQQQTNVSVFTDKDELLGGWQQAPLFFFTQSIRRIFPLKHSSVGGSVVTVYGLGFIPGRGYTCTFVAAADSSQIMSHSSGAAPGFTVIKCQVPAWGAAFRAGQVLLKVTAPAQTSPIPADNGTVLYFDLEPAVVSLLPTVIQLSRAAVAVVNGSGFGANMNVTLRLKSNTDEIVAANACSILSFTYMTCPVPPWGSMFSAQTVQVIFDVTAPDVRMVYTPPNTHIKFLESVQNVHPLSGAITGGTVLTITCEGLSTGLRIVVRFADINGNVLSSIPVLPANAGSIVVASPNWLFTFPSSVTFTADVSVSILTPHNCVPDLLCIFAGLQLSDLSAL